MIICSTHRRIFVASVRPLTNGCRELVKAIHLRPISGGPYHRHVGCSRAAAQGTLINISRLKHAAEISIKPSADIGGTAVAAECKRSWVRSLSSSNVRCTFPSYTLSQILEIRSWQPYFWSSSAIKS